MSSFKALGLNDDIVGEILAFSPTFKTLHATVLVSKAFYRVFRAHPKSITRAVAYNLVGPALPQALRVIRHPYRDYLMDKAPFPRIAACPEDCAPPVIAAREKMELEANARLVGQMEDIYSLMVKDRTSKTSILTSVESWRFRRAMYRIMLYCTIFSSHHYEGVDDEDIVEIEAQRTALLNEYNTDELKQLYSAVQFLSNVFDSSNCDYVSLDALLSTGPSGAVHAWESRGIDGVLGVQDSEWTEGYFAYPLANVYRARKVALPSFELPSAGILDSVNGADDVCSRCAAPHGLELYTETTWRRFATDYVLLKPKLSGNPTILHYFQEVVDPLVETPRHAGELYRRFVWAANRRVCYLGSNRPVLPSLLHRVCAAARLGVVITGKDERFVIVVNDSRLGLTEPQLDGSLLKTAGALRAGWKCELQHEQHHAETKNHLCDPVKI
ncbi:hypothetical protein MSAN_02492100 [Mycena sanguinolenta]|uniref:F-box domain-containing protein n=1 Tax=Mycena sanguinolenta TaxID=230812 RepID=A0A8H6TX04_9AGAR|nr:hypothetical protein MSAN_02492100 [Mycena sanguinolenta]